MKAQGIDPKSNYYANPLQPYLSYWGIFWTALFVLINGFPVFFVWDTAKFLTSCKPPLPLNTPFGRLP